MMKIFKYAIIPFVLLVAIFVLSGYGKSSSEFKEKEFSDLLKNEQKQTVNLFVTHGHCSTPFVGIVDNLNLHIPLRTDLGNPLENMELSFEISPDSFNVCAGDDLTSRIKTPGLFINNNGDKIIFKSTQVYTMGIDWYQVNGKMSIKGVENDVKFFITGIRDPKNVKSDSLVLQGQLNLFDWGIDYDKIVNGKSNPVPTKWMHLNMKIEMS